MYRGAACPDREASRTLLGGGAVQRVLIAQRLGLCCTEKTKGAAPCGAAPFV